ncbi:hypothetical protein D3C81_1928880 [compost metagenome]
MATCSSCSKRVRKRSELAESRAEQISPLSVNLRYSEPWPIPARFAMPYILTASRPFSENSARAASRIR